MGLVQKSTLEEELARTGKLVYTNVGDSRNIFPFIPAMERKKR